MRESPVVGRNRRRARCRTPGRARAAPSASAAVAVRGRDRQQCRRSEQHSAAAARLPRPATQRLHSSGPSHRQDRRRSIPACARPRTPIAPRSRRAECGRGSVRRAATQKVDRPGMGRMVLLQSPFQLCRSSHRLLLVGAWPRQRWPAARCCRRVTKPSGPPAGDGARCGGDAPGAATA